MVPIYKRLLILSLVLLWLGQGAGRAEKFFLDDPIRSMPKPLAVPQDRCFVRLPVELDQAEPTATGSRRSGQQPWRGAGQGVVYEQSRQTENDT
jgi:hypothetical protein